MIYQIIDLPPNMIGFKASWEVTKRDFEEVVIPSVQKHVEKMGQLNYMLVINASIHNFTLYAWLKDALIGLKQLTKWKRACIVSDSKAIKLFTQFFSFVLPGEFRGFSHNELKQAIEWTSEADKK